MAEIDPVDDNVVALPNGTTESSTAPRKKFRKIKVLESKDGQFYYVSTGRNGEVIYTSETFGQRSDAIRAARREHSGRSDNFDYILEYNNAGGNLIRETL